MFYRATAISSSPAATAAVGAGAGQIELFRNLAAPLITESISFRVMAHRHFIDAAVFQWPKASMTMV